MKPKETIKQLERALKHQDLDNVSRLVSIMDIEEINQASIAMEDDFDWANDHYIEHTPILFAIRKNNLKLLELLLNIKGIQLTGTKTCESPLFLAIMLHRTEMIPLLLKHPDINVNEIGESRVRDKTTPISLAYGTPKIFSMLLQATGIDIHIGIENSSHFIHYIQAYSNGSDSEFIPTPQLIKHYCDLLIKTPQKMSEIFKQKPEILSFLVKNRSELLKALNEKVYSLEAAAYYTLLKTIVDSAHQTQSEQHPFYTVFSTPIHQFALLGFVSTWFGGDQRSELKQLQEKVDLVKETQLLCCEKSLNGLK